jgi:ankyrin repeat protein
MSTVQGKKMEEHSYVPQLKSATWLSCTEVRELGAAVNHALQSGATPLFIAAENGQLAVVRCLVDDLMSTSTKPTTREQPPCLTL